jgi:hypothetical protein
MLLMEKYADFENVCAKPLRLMKIYAAFENVRAVTTRNNIRASNVVALYSMSAIR